MANFKCVFQFTQPDKGFSEVYYRTASDLAAATVFDLETRRRAVRFRHKLTVLRAIRVSEVTNNRNAVVIRVNRSTDSIGIKEPDICSTAAVYTLNAPTTGARRQVWFRGLNDGDVLRDASNGADLPSADLISGIESWVRTLANNGFTVRALAKIDGVTIRYTNVTNIIVDANGIVNLTFPAGFTPTFSNRVILSQFDQKLWPGLNGAWFLTNVSTGVYTIKYKSHLPAGTYIITKGRSRPEEFTYGAISANLSDFNKFSSRDTGRNPTGGRGRRSTKFLRAV